MSDFYASGIALSADDLAFRDQWRAWLDANLPEQWGQPGFRLWANEREQERFLSGWRQRLYEDGWSAIAWPREYGGREASVMQQVIFKEELIARKLPHPMVRVSAFEDTGRMAGEAVLQYGSDEQKQRFIPGILRGELRFCQGFSEPDAGSDLAGLKTRAVIEGDEFVVNGQKVWTSGAQHSDWVFLLVRTDPDAPKHRGISLLLVDLKSPGITVQPIREISGGARFNAVYFEDVRVPRDNLVGEMNRGWEIARSTLEHERSGLLGANIIDGTLGSLVRLAHKRLPGESAAPWDDADTRRRIAMCAVTLEGIRQIGFGILMKQMKGERLAAEPDVGKLAGSELRQAMTEMSLDMLGRYGPLLGDSKLAVNSATSEMQRNGIAEKGLGLPKD